MGGRAQCGVVQAVNSMVVPAFVRVKTDSVSVSSSTSAHVPSPSPSRRSKANVGAYQRHHWKPAIASADVNGVAGNSWATNKSASARSTAVAFYPRVPGVSFIFPQGRRRCIEFN